MAETALVIGGTGPTGHYVVNGLLERGFQVAILHTGNHEVDEIPEQVEHIHTNPFDIDALRNAIADRNFDLVVATYGRLRRVAEVMVGRCQRFISVGGGPAYLGYMNADALEPSGLAVPTEEDAQCVTEEQQDGKGFRIKLTEERLFDVQPDATHFRYPYIYGKYQIAPREWCIVRRILDKRDFIILADGGQTLNHYGFAANMAHALLLAVDKPQVSQGQIYNCGDEEVLTLRQVVELIAKTLHHDIEIVSMPFEWASPARPLLQQPWSSHRVFDLAKIKSELGYRDLVSARKAIPNVARELANEPLPYGGAAEKILQDPFDYGSEDALRAQWLEVETRMNALADATQWASFEPWYGTSYSGPGGKPRAKPFE